MQTRGEFAKLADLLSEPNLTANLTTILIPSPSARASESSSPLGPPRAAQSCADPSTLPARGDLPPPCTPFPPPGPQSFSGPVETRGKCPPCELHEDSPAPPWDPTASRCWDSQPTRSLIPAARSLRLRPRLSAAVAPRPLPAAGVCSPGVARAEVGGAPAGAWTWPLPDPSQAPTGGRVLSSTPGLHRAKLSPGGLAENRLLRPMPLGMRSGRNLELWISPVPARDCRDPRSPSAGQRSR